MNKHQIVSISLLALLPACSSTQPKQRTEIVRVRVMKPAESPPQSNYDTVRNAEVIKQYYAGEYIDPNNPSVRHSAHNIQRVEEAASWNLRPGEPVVSGGPTYVSASAAAQTNAIAAQLSGALDRQKGYTDALAAQNEKLQAVIEQMNAVKEEEAQARAATDAELKLTNESLRTLKQEINKQPVARPFPVYAPQPTPSLFDSLEAPPSNSMLTPEIKDILDTIDDHITALENTKAPEQQPSEDMIELDDIYAPLVAQRKK